MLETNRHSITAYHTGLSKKSCWCEQLWAPLLLLTSAPPFLLSGTRRCPASPGRAPRGTRPAGKRPAQGKGTTEISSWRWRPLPSSWSLPGVFAAHGASLASTLWPLPASGLQGDTQGTARSTGLPGLFSVPKPPSTPWQFRQEQGCYSKEMNFISQNTKCIDFSQEGLHFARKVFIFKFVDFLFCLVI